MGLQFQEVIPWGRSFDEYQRMFALTSVDLETRILGCGDGPASFNAEATRRGHRIVSCDPVYALSSAVIEERVRASYDSVISQVKRDAAEFVWDVYPDADALGRSRLTAMRLFLDDFEPGQAAGRYVTAALPELPFADQQFDLALVSHFLFLYSDHFDLEFHVHSVHELLRVAAEVRIFPIITLDRAQSPHLTAVCDDCRRRGFAAEIRNVAYEFQRGGNQVLRIARESRVR